MKPTPSLKTISALLMEHGAHFYGGEAISQLEHALQCGALAEAAGEAPPMVVAAFLHDLGHLLAAEDPSVDDRHQEVGANVLAQVFGPAVSEPVRLHVAAKRYLCATRPGYHDTLSDASKHTLVLQGGVFTAAQAGAFENAPFAREAVRLRDYDDGGKVVGMRTPGLDHFLALAASLVAPGSAQRRPT